MPRIFLPGELYASAAALGALSVYLLSPVLDGNAVLIAGSAVTLVTRLAARRYRLTLPTRDPSKPLLEDSGKSLLEDKP